MATPSRRQQAKAVAPVSDTRGPNWSDKHLKVSADLGEYKTDQVLTTFPHIINHIRNLLNDGADEQSTLTDEQIKAVFLATSIDNMDAATAEDTLINAATSIESSEDSPLTDASLSALAPEILSATELGAKMDEAGGAFIDQTIEKGKDVNAAPIVFAHDHIMRVYTPEEIASFPPIRSRRRNDPKKDNRNGDIRHKVAPSEIEAWNKANSPVDYGHTYDHTQAKYVNWRWLDGFVDSFPHRRAFNVRLEHLKHIVDNNGEILPSMSDELKALGGREKLPLAQDAYDNARADRTKYRNKVENALRYIQRKAEMAEFKEVELHFAQEWENPGLPVESMARSNKPFSLWGIIPPDVNNPRERVVPGKAISLGTLMSYDLPKIRQMGGKAATFDQSRKRGTKKKGGATGTAAPAFTVVRPTTAKELMDQTIACSQYLEGPSAEANLRNAMKGPNGGEIAYWVCFHYDQLANLANDKNVRLIANAFDQQQMTAKAAAEQAEAAKAALPATTSAAA